MGQQLAQRISGGQGMSDDRGELSRLADLAAKVRAHEHLCLIYDNLDQQLAAAVPFLRSGLERGERCLYIADDNSRTALLDVLHQSGVEVDRYFQSGALIITGKRETYLRDGRFDPDLWIRFLSESLHDPTGRYSGFKTMLGEMTWASGPGVSCEALIEYESKLAYFLRDNAVRALCQYRRDRFSPQVIRSVIQTHPIVVYGGLICENPYYVPPEEFLKTDQASREVERLLNNILNRQQSLAQLRALAARLQTVREEERTRAAREIHDELGQALTAIKIDFASLLLDLPEAAREIAAPRGQSILKLLDQAIHSVQRIGTELRPGILDDMGLVAALEWAAEDFQTRTGVKCDIRLPNIETPFEPELATALFRIFQETLTNVARHAEATQVNARLTEEKSNLSLEIRDNGKGISDEQLSVKSSLGILGMRERVLLLGGTLTISSILGEGTTVRVVIPFSGVPQDQ